MSRDNLLFSELQMLKRVMAIDSCPMIGTPQLAVGRVLLRAL